MYIFWNLHLQYRYNIFVYIHIFYHLDLYSKNTHRMYILDYIGWVPWTLVIYVICFNLRRPRGSSVHPQESAATFDEIPCWTPLADALLATLHMDDDVSSGPKTRWKKTHQEGGGCFSHYLRCAFFPAKTPHRFRFWLAPKMDHFILLCI